MQMYFCSSIEIRTEVGKTGTFLRVGRLISTGRGKLVEDGRIGAGKAYGFTENLRRNVGVIFKKTTEIKLVFEAKNIGDLFYSLGGHIQLSFCLDDDPLGD